MLATRVRRAAARSRRKSATIRSATAGPSAVRSRTATRRATCPRRCSRSTPPSWCRGRAAPVRSRRTEFFRGFLETALDARRAAHRDPGPEVGRGRIRVREVQPPCPGLGDRRCGRGAGERRDPRRARQHGLGAPACHRGRDRAGPGSFGGGSGPRGGGRVPSRSADLNASPEYRAHLAQVLVRRALEAL